MAGLIGPAGEIGRFGERSCSHLDPKRPDPPAEDDFGTVTVEPPIVGHNEIIETAQTVRLAHKVLSRLDQARMDAPSPVMGHVESTFLVARDEWLRVLRLQTPEVVAPGKDQQIAAEAVAPDVRHLPCPIWVYLG